MPTEFLGHGASEKNYGMLFDADGLNYFLTCTAYIDQTGETVKKGNIRKLVFEQPRTFYAIDMQRKRNKLPRLPDSEREKILFAFEKAVFHETTGYGKRLNDHKKMLIVESEIESYIRG